MRTLTEFVVPVRLLLISTSFVGGNGGQISLVILHTIGLAAAYRGPLAGPGRHCIRAITALASDSFGVDHRPVVIDVEAAQVVVRERVCLVVLPLYCVHPVTDVPALKMGVSPGYA